MTRTLLRIMWLNLKRDRAALALTFVLPIAFFSIFAVIFGNVGTSGGGPGSLAIIVVDEDGSETSRRFVEALGDQAALRVVTGPDAAEDAPAPAAFTRDEARARVRDGHDRVALVLPPGFGASFGDFMGGGEPVELIYDAADPIARHSVAGLLQAAAMTAAPDVLMERGLSRLETFGGPLTPEQRAAVDEILPALRGERDGTEPGRPDTDPDAEADTDTDPEADMDTDAVADPEAAPAFTGLVTVHETPAQADDDENGDGTPNMTAYYAAGIGVMFLLFSMAGAAGSLLEEENTGTLERVLSSRVSMGLLLLGKWLFFALVGIAQLVLMFLWGAIVFGLDLFTLDHLVGFTAMTIVTAAAAAAFGILLATLCRSQAQLSGISTIVILIMSALGGSMVPRFVMPAFMNTTSLFTFNGWALDGYLKVFWYGDPDASPGALLLTLLPQLAVLAAAAAAFLLAARRLARRWEVA